MLELKQCETNENIISKEYLHKETQTDEGKKDKLIEVNHKLKRALQIIKEKLNEISNERPDLFSDSPDDIIQKFNHFVHVFQNQSKQIHMFQVQLKNAQQCIDQLQRFIHLYLSFCFSFFIINFVFFQVHRIKMKKFFVSIKIILMKKIMKLI